MLCSWQKEKDPYEEQTYPHTCFVRSFSTFVLHFEFETVSLSLSLSLSLSVFLSCHSFSLCPQISEAPRFSLSLSLFLSLSIYIYHAFLGFPVLGFCVGLYLLSILSKTHHAKTLVWSLSPRTHVVFLRLPNEPSLTIRFLGIAEPLPDDHDDDNGLMGP